MVNRRIYKEGEGVWHNGRFHRPPAVLPDDQRVMPDTLPDELAYDHMSKPYGCRCPVCLRPAAARYQRRWRIERGLRA